MVLTLIYLSLWNITDTMNHQRIGANAMHILDSQELHLTRIFTVLRFQTDKSDWIGRARPFHCFAYQIQGSSYHTFNNIQQKIEPGTILFIPKDVSFSVKTDGKQTESIVVHFSIDNTDAFNSMVYQPRNAKNMQVLFEELEFHYLQKQPGSYARCCMLFYEIFAQLSEQHYMNTSSATLRKALAPAIILMQSRISDPLLRVDTLAKTVGFSRQHFRKLFCQAYNNPPNQYLRSIRVEYAKSMLRSPYYSISQIAERSGFTSIFYFSRVFKQATGMSPTKYRQQS